MKKYTDQGKVDTRSCFGTGGVPRAVKRGISYGSVIFLLFFSVTSCCGLFEKEEHHPALGIKYCIDGHYYEFDVDRTPSPQGGLLKQLSQKYKFYNRPCFYYDRETDSLTFRITLPDEPLRVEGLKVFSDTTAFFYDIKYYLHSNKSGLYLEGIALSIEEGWLKFSPSPYPYLSYILEFELTVKNYNDFDRYLKDGVCLESKKPCLLSGSIEVLYGITDDRIGNLLKKQLL